MPTMNNYIERIRMKVTSPNVGNTKKIRYWPSRDAGVDHVGICARISARGSSLHSARCCSLFYIIHHILTFINAAAYDGLGS